MFLSPSTLPGGQVDVVKREQAFDATSNLDTVAAPTGLYLFDLQKFSFSS